MTKLFRCHSSTGSHPTGSNSGIRSTIEWIDQMISKVVLPIPKDRTSPTTPHSTNNSKNSDHKFADSVRRRVLSQQRERAVWSLGVPDDARQWSKNILVRKFLSFGES